MSFVPDGERATATSPMRFTRADRSPFLLLLPPDGNISNPIVNSPNAYTGEIEWTAFDYRVSVAVCAVFTALFAISLSQSLPRA